MESVIKSLEKMILMLEREMKDTEFRIKECQDEINSLRDQLLNTEKKMHEAAAAMDYLSKSRSEIKDAAGEIRIEVW